ncbi:MAG TPA: hypothetical protein VE631_09875, partial [Alphaproteobacteria bacterium]|nr:hypothetical protein [Alphaproteobacteria bacterium]
MALGYRPDIQVHPLFPTPVVISPVPGAERLNAELTAVIDARMATDPGTQHSNLGGWQSSWDLPEWGDEAVECVLEHARAI